MIEKAKQYKNLILLILIAVFLALLVASDPLGFCAKRAHDRAAIYNQMAVEKAEAEKEIAVIQARTEAELERIRQGLEVPEEETETEERQ